MLQQSTITAADLYAETRHIMLKLNLLCFRRFGLGCAFTFMVLLARGRLLRAITLCCTRGTPGNWSHVIGRSMGWFGLERPIFVPEFAIYSSPAASIDSAERRHLCFYKTWSASTRLQP